MINAQQSLLDNLTVNARDDLTTACTQLAGGTITHDHWLQIIFYLLLQSHQQAAQLGRHLAGDFSGADSLDKEFAEHVMDGEKPFAAAFGQDVASGRYDTTDASGATTLNIEAVIRRALMYTGRLTGTANEAWVAASDPEALFYWRLGANEDHCSACPELAENSPYTTDTLPTTPGANQTPCLFNCHCHLERDDGVIGFTTVPN